MLALVAAAAIQLTCGPAPDVMSALSSKYGERPAWTGRAQNGVYVLIESRKGTWTLLLMPSRDVACGVDSGINSKPVFGEPA